MAYGGSSVGATSYNVVMYGHSEWYDYYSNGVYIGSYEERWVVDGFLVTYQHGSECGDAPCGSDTNVNS